MRVLAAAFLFLVVGCASPEGKGLAPTPAGDGAVVRFDVWHKPLPEIPLPNDFATRFDALSPTLRRLNASQVAPTEWETLTRKDLDDLDGWGTLAPITVAFDAPIDTENVIRRHWFDRFDVSDDVLLVVNVTPDSPEFCQAAPMDLGQGHYPVRLDRPDYYPDDPRGNLINLQFEETEEDLNHNGVLDPGEDTDMDGVLDHPNTRGGGDSSLITFYERETNTLIARPLVPLHEATTYAVVLTRALVDLNGNPVRSPFPYVNHTSQTRALSPLGECLPKLGLSMDEVSFTWAFSTQAWTRPFVAIRDGLYGLGPMKHLATDFPPDPTLHDGRKKGAGIYTKVVPGSMFLNLASDLYTQFAAGNNAAQAQVFLENFKFIDFHVTGALDSPQFFPRYVDDTNTEQLPLTKQVWQVDPLSGAAFIRPEGVNFWMMVPKNRGGKPAPVAIFIHGHGSTKFDAINVAGFLARAGIATIGIDAVSHGVDVDPLTLELVRGKFNQYDIEPMFHGIIDGRALDQNHDGMLDSGADYWTAYVFHTRDVVRQTAIDLMQVIRMLKSFDGVRTWKYDANLDGKPDLAGDFDGDGVVDVGGSAPVHLIGGSLGGILSAFVGGLEPDVDAIVPIIGGGVLMEVGARSSLGGVRDGMVLRMMGPLVFVRDGVVSEGFPDLTHYKEVNVATLTQPVVPGSVAVLENLDSHEYRCARVQSNGHLRISVPSDAGQRLRLSLYAGELPTKAPEGCVPEGTPVEVVDTFQETFTWNGKDWTAGSPFASVTDGFGLRRANPELRRMLGLSQVALEGADPANSAPFMDQNRVLTYGNGQTVATRSFYINTLGDPGVPTASGIAMGRAQGLIDYKNIDPRYGKTVQQMLIDTGTVEGTEGSRRYVNSAGDAVLMDVDDLEAVAGVGDGFEVPRLAPPLRLIRDNQRVGGKRGMLFPMMDPHGVHGFPLPSPDKPFDLGSMMILQAMRYLSTDGEELSIDTCQLNWSCAWLPPLLP